MLTCTHGVESNQAPETHNTFELIITSAEGVNTHTLLRPRSFLRASSKPMWRTRQEVERFGSLRRHLGIVCSFSCHCWFVVSMEEPFNLLKRDMFLRAASCQICIIRVVFFNHRSAAKSLHLQLCAIHMMRHVRTHPHAWAWLSFLPCIVILPLQASRFCQKHSRKQ